MIVLFSVCVFFLHSRIQFRVVEFFRKFDCIWECKWEISSWCLVHSPWIFLKNSFDIVNLLSTDVGVKSVDFFVFLGLLLFLFVLFASFCNHFRRTFLLLPLSLFYLFLQYCVHFNTVPTRLWIHPCIVMHITQICHSLSYILKIISRFYFYNY